MSEVLDDSQLLKELEPTVEAALSWHLEKTDKWYPHEYVPYSEGVTFEPGEVWQPADSELSKATQSALYLNLLTEDNLPYYFQHINHLFGADGAWRAWSHRWTAEEGRHAIVLRDYLTVKRAIDLVALEDGRMAQVSGGEVPTPTLALDGLAYVTLQELATREAHRNTGKQLDSTGDKLLARVAQDENFHFIFYRRLTKAAIELQPSATVEAIQRQVKGFKMPGTGIPNFEEHEFEIAMGGIFGVTELLRDVIEPTLNHWKIKHLEGLTPAAEKAREALYRRVGALARVSQKELAAREEYAVQVVATTN